MYNVSNEYRTAIEKLSRQTELTGLITLTDGRTIPISDSDIMQGTFNIDNACVNGQEFELGAVYVAQLKTSIDTEVDRYSIYGATVSASFRLKLADDTFETVPLGVFTVNEATRSGKYISLTAYDNMISFDKDFTDVTNGTPFELLQMASTECGVELGQTEQRINELSPKTSVGEIITLKINEKNSISTYRDLISDIAMTLGGFATIDRSGRLVVKCFGTDTVELSSNHLKSKTVSDYSVAYSRVTAKIAGSTYTVGDDTAQTLTVENDLWNTGTDDTKNSIIENIYDKIKDVNYIPCVLEYDGDPAIDLGDVLAYNDIDGINIVNSYNMANSWTYRNKQRLSAVGSNPKLAKAKTKTDKQINTVGSIASQNGMKIVDYKSSSIYEIGAEQTIICEMDVVVSEKGSLNFSGQACLNVTKSGTFQISYELNGEPYTYQPSQLAPYAGKYIISLMQPLKNLNANVDNLFKVYMSSEDGEATIEAGDVVAMTMGSITAGSGGGFNGIINISEQYSMLSVGGFDVSPFINEVTEEVYEPTPVLISLIPPLTSNDSEKSTTGVPFVKLDNAAYYFWMDWPKNFQMFDGAKPTTFLNNNGQIFTKKGTTGIVTCGFCFNSPQSPDCIIFYPELGGSMNCVAPSIIRVMVSNDGTTFTQIGEDIANLETSSASVTIPVEGVNHKYICLQFEFSGTWLGVSEIEMYKGGSPVPPPPTPTEVLEYLQSTGTQWINTGVNYTNSDVYKIETQISWNSDKISTRQLMGADSVNCYWGIKAGGNYDNAYLDTGIKAATDDTYDDVSFEYNNGTQTMTINGVTKTKNGAGKLSTAYMLKIADGFYCCCRIKSFKQYKNGELVRDFVPMRIDEQVGFFDNVSNTLFVNNGTGEFVAPD